MKRNVLDPPQRMQCNAEVSGYRSRWDLILNRCKGRTVLHLGCIGETDRSVHERVEALRNCSSLHSQVVKVASEVIGVDLNAESVELARSQPLMGTLFAGDVEHLEQLPVNGTFDVILFGDLIEHLSCPGMALNGIRRFMSSHSELIISTPNAFSLPANIKFSLGLWAEGDEHVAAYSPLTLRTILQRHGFTLFELFTSYDHPPRTFKDRVLIALGTQIFRAIPRRGGTLLGLAKLA